MQDFIDDTGTSVISHIPDTEGEIWARFGVTQQHTYVFINDDGSWRVADYGSLAEDVEGLIAS